MGESIIFSFHQAPLRHILFLDISPVTHVDQFCLVDCLWKSRWLSKYDDALLILLSYNTIWGAGIFSIIVGIDHVENKLVQ
jgi:hypothetical protein